jgi:PTS system mannose-specific IIC component
LGIIPLCLISALIALDTAAVFQVMIAQPIVACSLIGLISNDLAMGMQVGLIMQLIWISILPIGAALFPDGNFGSMIAAIIAIVLNRDLPHSDHVIIAFSVMFGLIFSFVGAHALKFIRMGNVLILNRLLSKIKGGNLNYVGISISYSLIFHYLITVSVMLVSVFLGNMIIRKILFYIPDVWNGYLRFFEIAILGAGFGLTIAMFKDRYSINFFLAGFIVYIILGLLFLI